MKVLRWIGSVLLFLAAPASGTVYNAPCNSDMYCHSQYTHSYRCELGNCMRRPFDYNHSEIVGAFITVVICMFANAGGLGAGAVIIPIYMIFYGFSATDSVPLSKITIFAGAVVNFVLMWKTRQPKNPNKFLIDFNQAAIIVPLLLAGTQIGVILSKLLPPIAIIGGLVTFLVKSSSQMYERAIKEMQREREAFATMREQELELASNKKHEEKIMDEEQDSRRSAEDKESISEVTTSKSESKDNHVQPLSDKSTTESTTSAPIPKVDKDESMKLDTSEERLPTIVMMNNQITNFGFMFLSLGVVIITALMRGGEGMTSIVNIDKCSSASFVFLVFSQVVAALISFKAYKHNHYNLSKDVKASDASAEGHNNKLFYLVSYFTGIAAGALGIGGGMVLGPYMLAMGLDAQTSTALSGFIVLFTSSSTTSQFTIAGAIHFRHAWLFMLTSLIGSVIGGVILKALILKYKRPSIIVWVVFGILVISLIILPAEMTYRVLDNYEVAFSFGTFC